ncbi:hypothetical protein e2017b09.tmp0272 [Eimeria tenella]|uniref:Uncharacterized protein n=1 Tax=Eimeria tenella TaxID=5802 RepID=C8TDX7_EIMTE|nr:hypothetical protein e2017b09.tmp0272 [Eimeria tenella]
MSAQQDQQCETLAEVFGVCKRRAWTNREAGALCNGIEKPLSLEFVKSNRYSFKRSSAAL